MADTNLQAVIGRLLKITYIGRDQNYRVKLNFCEPQKPDYDVLEDLARLPQVLRHFQKEISDRDSIIHDLKEDSPAYVLVVEFGNGGTTYFPSRSLFEAKLYGEEMARNAIEMMGWRSVTIYDGHTYTWTMMADLGGRHWAWHRTPE